MTRRKHYRENLSRVPLLAIVVLTIGVRAFGSDGPTTPAEVLDLARWKLTLPYDTRRAGNPDEVLQPELATFTDPTCFYAEQLDGDGPAVVFRAACDGLGTVNSKYPRSELRQMAPGGEDEIGWATDDGGVHTLEVDLAVTHLPTRKPHVVCVQVHDAEDDVLMLRVEGKKLLLERCQDGDLRLVSDYELGTRLCLKIEASDGRLRAWHDDEQVMDWPIVKRGCYYKLGCYTQSSREIEADPGEYGEVRVYAAEVVHQRP
ncbi:MAG: polysaccharide lyase family 7 protein [Planctomycetota bacterium]